MPLKGTAIYMVAGAELSISKRSEQVLNLYQGETLASRTIIAIKISLIAMAESGY